MDNKNYPGTKALSTYGLGLYTAGNANQIVEAPTELGSHALLIIRVKYGLDGIATALIGIESASDGIYARYSENGQWIKVGG